MMLLDDEDGRIGDRGAAGRLRRLIEATLLSVVIQFGRDRFLAVVAALRGPQATLARIHYLSRKAAARYPVRMAIDTFRIAVEGADTVSALWEAPAKARACLVLAHGAGVGMTHKSMAAIADGLAARDIATLRYQFPFMERRSRRPDPPRIAHAAVRAAVAEAAERAPRLPLFAGGRSFGGRMTSQAQALAPLHSVRGLVFFAFPLHPAGTPSTERADHLSSVAIPMLFLQGTHDTLAEVSLLRPLVAKLGPRATLKLIEDADHSFHVPAKTGRKDDDVLGEILDAAATWIKEI